MPLPTSTPTPTPTPSPLPLSVCLIARDEAPHLPGLMASVQGLAQEVVVVDTGSTDGTPELAASLGARVLHTPWSDDFAAARNVALAAARAEWILTLDADQVLDTTARAALAAAVRRTDCLAQLVTIRLLGTPLADGAEHVVQRLPSLRLVRRDARIRYRGRVHEDVSGSLCDIGSTHWPDSGVTLTDHGYIQAAARQRKLARNLALLWRAHAEEPQALHTAYKLATSLPADAAEERARVLAQALQVACTLPEPELRAQACLPRLAAAALGELVAQGRLAEAAEAVRTLLARSREALAFTGGCVLARAGHFDEARATLQAYLEATGREPSSSRAHGSPLWLADEAAHPAQACRWLAWMAHVEGHSEQAQRWLARGREASADQPCWALEALAVEMLAATGQARAAAQALQALGARAGIDPAELAQVLPELMCASARVALADGDAATAQEFARQSAQAADDAGTVLLAQLDIDAGRTDTTTLSTHHEAIRGQRFDTLAVKLTIGAHLGRPWPHPVPPATRALLGTAG